MLPDDQLPEEVPDTIPQDGPEDTAPDPLAEMQAGYAQIMDELVAGPEASPGDSGASYSQSLDELVPDAPFTPPVQMPLGQDTADAPLASPVAPPAPRPYTRPQDRTPATRQARRAQQADFLTQKAQDIEDFHLGKLPEDEGEGDKGNHPTDASLRNVLEATTRTVEGATDWLVDLSRRLEAVERRLEGERL